MFTVYRIAMCGQLDALVYVLATTCVPQLPGRGVAWLATAVFSAAVLVTVLLGAVGGGSREVVLAVSAAALGLIGVWGWRTWQVIKGRGGAR